MQSIRDGDATVPREGGCLCGAVRYRTKGEPARSSVCHCTFCQRRSGSAFGVGAYFNEADVEFTQRGVTKTYEHLSDESGRWLRIEFCLNCGGTVTWTAEALPGMRAIAVGSFDDPKWFQPGRFGWMRSAHPWIIPPPGVEVFPQGTLPTAKK
jgi:hypothetical protein